MANLRNILFALLIIVFSIYPECDAMRENRRGGGQPAADEKEADPQDEKEADSIDMADEKKDKKEAGGQERKHKPDMRKIMCFKKRDQLHLFKLGRYRHGSVRTNSDLSEVFDAHADTVEIANVERDNSLFRSLAYLLAQNDDWQYDKLRKVMVDHDAKQCLGLEVPKFFRSMSPEEEVTALRVAASLLQTDILILPLRTDVKSSSKEMYVSVDADPKWYKAGETPSDETLFLGYFFDKKRNRVFQPITNAFYTGHAPKFASVEELAQSTDSDKKAVLSVKEPTEEEAIEAAMRASLHMPDRKAVLSAHDRARLSRDLKLSPVPLATLAETVDLTGDTVHIADVALDGNCFFRTIAYLLTGDESHHTSLRERVVAHMRTDMPELFDSEAGENKEEHLAKMKKNGKWATHLEVLGVASLLQTDIWIFLLRRDLSNPSNPTLKYVEPETRAIRYPCSTSPTAEETSSALFVGNFRDAHYMAITDAFFTSLIRQSYTVDKSSTQLSTDDKDDVGSVHSLDLAQGSDHSRADVIADKSSTQLSTHDEDDVGSVHSLDLAQGSDHSRADVAYPSQLSDNSKATVADVTLASDNAQATVLDANQLSKPSQPIVSNATPLSISLQPNEADSAQLSDNSQHTVADTTQLSDNSQASVADPTQLSNHSPRDNSRPIDFTDLAQTFKVLERSPHDHDSR